MRAWALGLGLLVGASAASPVWAHGRFPAAGLIAIDPGNPDRVWVRTTYGLLVTSDHGKNWRWVCQEAVGFNADREDPPVVISADGSVTAGTFAGLRVSHDGCAWEGIGGDLADRFYVDIQAEADPAQLVTLSSNGVMADAFEVNLWASSDNAATWTHLGVSPPADFLALTLGLALSDPNRIYLTGRDGVSGAYEAVFFRSIDRGQAWTRVPLPEGMSTDGRLVAYMGGVDPTNPDRVYVGTVENDLDTIVRFVVWASDDGGDTWQNVFERPHSVSAFALSPDGSTIAVGINVDDTACPDCNGLWIGQSSDLMFTKRSTLHVGCLTWTDRGIYACGDEFKDGYTAAFSEDGGQTFTPLMNLSSPCGPLECPADTSVEAECNPRWAIERNELGAKDCTPPPPPDPPPDDDGSCDCRTPSDKPSALIAWLFAIGAALLRRKTSRRGF